MAAEPVATDQLNFQSPPGLCDTHMHIYEAGYPIVSGATPPARGTLTNYRALRRALGIERTVIVQPAAYGFDNRCTLESMAQLGRDAARGIAVVRDDIRVRELRELTEAGMRGLRLAMIPGGAIGWDDAEATVCKVQAVGWHTQLQLDGLQLPAREAQIKRWPGTIVIDHIGKFSGAVTPDHPAVQCLARLLGTGRVWLKLSAPYWASRSGPPHYGDVEALAKHFVSIAPERMVWATNWPHPSLSESPNDAQLFNCIAGWIPDAALRQRIFVDNPAQLYGF
ncbi:MAG TPA: amidohydrolase family protein [Bradyrhizobium sp.]|nr:amidohydrolase family protein [Bradyrhizobium sp.]